jgi:hypothetical protein
MGVATKRPAFHSSQLKVFCVLVLAGRKTNACEHYNTPERNHHDSGHLG